MKLKGNRNEGRSPLSYGKQNGFGWWSHWARAVIELASLWMTMAFQTNDAQIIALKSSLKQVESSNCTIYKCTALNYKMTICYQRLRKHAKPKYWLLQQKCYSQYILLWMLAFVLACVRFYYSPSATVCQIWNKLANKQTALCNHGSKQTRSAEIVQESIQTKKPRPSRTEPWGCIWKNETAWGPEAV